MNLISMPTVRLTHVSGGSLPTTTLSMAQLAQLSGVATDELDSLMEFGVLTAIRPELEPATFDIAFVMTLQRARRLREDLALDDHAFALAVMLLQQVADLEEEVRIVRSEARRHLAGPTH